MTDLYATITATLAPRPAFPSIPDGCYSIQRMIETVSVFTEWRAILNEFYPGAVQVTVETESEYNDEGYSDSISKVTAYDQLGNEVPFQQVGATSQDELDDAFRDVLWEWPIPELGTIDLNDPPTLLYTTRTEMLERTQSMVAYVAQLPHGFFADDETAP